MIFVYNNSNRWAFAINDKKGGNLQKFNCFPKNGRNEMRQIESFHEAQMSESCYLGSNFYSMAVF